MIQVEDKLKEFMPNPSYVLDLSANYKKLNEKKQLFDIYSEYPKNTAQKLEKFMKAIITYN